MKSKSVKTSGNSNDVKEIRFVAIISLITGLALALIKLAAGIIGSSQVVIADAIHSFSDISTDLAIIIGLLFVVFGLWGVTFWWVDFFSAIKGITPFMFVCGGIITIVVGSTTIMDSIKARKIEILNKKDKFEEENQK